MTSIPNEGVATTKALVVIRSPTTSTVSVTDPPPPPPRKKKFAAAVKYMECLKNHAASIGGSATDGCGEFIAGGEEGTLEALICCACNCHRNFHRKIQLMQQQPQPLMRKKEGEAAGAGGTRKRFRSKFSQEQREKMQSFAEKSGWKLQKAGDAEVRSFCEEIGVKRKVLKVWMHNNKYQFANKIIN